MVKRSQIKKFPAGPGVYLMKDKQGQVIYVGKAASLKKRLAGYFARTQASMKTRIMLSYVEEIELLRTRSEHAALLSESRLIKKHRPRFNVSLKDDKSYPYIKITRGDVPRVFIGRRRRGERDVDLLGPYTNAKLLRQAFVILRESFPFRGCRRLPKKACLDYHLGLCPAPCAKKISKRAYSKIIRALEVFLLKRDSEVIEELSLQMRDLVRQERFEEAARLRDRLRALSMFISLKRTRGRKRPLPDRGFASLGLVGEPLRIEAFDVSHIQSSQAVAAMASFYKGRPDKDSYRRFRIRSFQRADDCAMIAEVVGRRYKRLLQEGGALPDLVVIDGGKGQLNAARKALEELRLRLPMIAIAKSEELIYTVGKRRPVKLTRVSAVLRLIQHLRDEAHRFAVSYHHLLRKKDAFRKTT